MTQKNEIFAIHVDGKIVDTKIWREFSKKYGTGQLYGWRPPKKIYMKLGHAKAALHHLPQQVQKKAKIVRYIPDESWAGK